MAKTDTTRPRKGQRKKRSNVLAVDLGEVGRHQVEEMRRALKEVAGVDLSRAAVIRRAVNYAYLEGGVAMAQKAKGE